MEELELIGLHDDGEHVVLRGLDGRRCLLRIDEPLRAAVRRDRPQLEQIRTITTGTLAPREIQARIRAGQTAEEVAAAADMPVEHVRRFEGPVLAEREYVAEQARTARIGRDHDSPVLGDLVADRLAARGADVMSLTWDAARHGAGPWTVVARFTAGDQHREARWRFDPATRALTADEDEARWLSETELEEPSRRHLAAVRQVVFDIDRPVTGEQPSTPTPASATANLLDELGHRRGRRRPVGTDPTEDFEGFGPKQAFDLPGAPPAKPPAPITTDVPTAPISKPPSTPTPTASTSPPSGASETATRTTSSHRGGRRKGRAKVPSWDEIVFGAKPE
ncbi:MAG: septation protein SepH [Micrococcales bacterium]|nr:septation protein SepH [Micrococcales bacterium]